MLPDFVTGTAARDLEDVQTQQPPDEKEGDAGHEQIADPLPGGFGFGAVFHETHYRALGACESCTARRLREGGAIGKAAEQEKKQDDEQHGSESDTGAAAVAPAAVAIIAATGSQEQ